MKMLFKKFMRIDESYRVCIPRDYAKLVGLNPGDPVEVVVTKKTVTFKFLKGEAAEVAKASMPKKRRRNKKLKEKGAN